ncbi:MAG: type II secretion system protein GspK [Syntrophaceae bacterium]|nr:type II secretion system protein GspK [Syntrophaceae bacterium]
MNPKDNGQKGIALVLILWVLAILSVIAGEFCYAMRAEVNITRNFKEGSEAYYYALAGVNRAIGELIRDKIMSRRTKLGLGRSKTEKEKALEASAEEAKEKARWRVNVDIPPVVFGAGAFKVRIGNEAGKINVNLASENVLKMMLNAFDLEDREKDIIVDSILDWRDEDDLHLLNGAENDYYNSLPEPYNCKNAPFDSVEELLLVRGITPEIYDAGLKDMVTVFLDNRATQKSTANILMGRSGSVFSSKVCINAAPEKVLRALPLMSDELVRKVTTFRKAKDFESPAEIVSVVGADVYKAISPYITVEENTYYTISTTGLIPGTQISRGIEAMVEINPTVQGGWRVVEWRDAHTRRRQLPENVD